MRKRLMVAITAFLMMAGMAHAQVYKTGIGLRLGPSNGPDLKHFLDPKSALDFQLTTRWGGGVITGLYEVHFPAFEEPGFQWYVGGGAHTGFFGNPPHTYWYDPRFDTYNAVWGVDGVLGLSYTFRDAPVNLSLDYKLPINLVNGGIWSDEVGLTVRYIIDR